MSLKSQLANGSPLLTPKDDNLRHMNSEYKADYFIFLGLYEGGEQGTDTSFGQGVTSQCIIIFFFIPVSRSCICLLCGAYLKCFRLLSNLQTWLRIIHIELSCSISITIKTAKSLRGLFLGNAYISMFVRSQNQPYKVQIVVYF